MSVQKRKVTIGSVSRWILPKVWTIGSVTAAVLQVLQVTNIYFSFSSVTLTSVYFPKEYLQPQISFCFPIILVMNWDMVIEQHPDIIDDMNFTGLTPDQIREEVDAIPFLTDRRHKQALFTNGRHTMLINNLTYFATDLITICHQLDNATNLIKEVDCFEGENFLDVAFFKEDLICYGFSNQLIYDHYLATKVIGSNGVVQIFEFNPLLRGRIPLSYYSSKGQNELPYLGAGFPKSLSLTTYRHYTMTFDLYQNHHLPPPYDDNCRQYSRDGLMSQDDCFESCERNFTTKRFNALISGPTFDTRDDKLMELDMRAVTSITMAEEMEMDTIRTVCDEKCNQVECDENIVIPVTKSENANDHCLKMTIAVPPTPAKVAQFIPSMSTIGYIVQLGSIIGFWTGLSLFHVYELFESFISHFVSNHNRR